MKNYIYRWMQWLWFSNEHNKKYSQWPFFAGTGWIVWDGVKWKSVSPPPFVYDPITETYTKLNDNAYAKQEADNDLNDPPENEENRSPPAKADEILL